PGASSNVDVGMLRAEGIPDAGGNLLPRDIEDGSAMLGPAAAQQPGPDGKIKIPASGPAEMQVVVNTGVFNPVTATCCSQCMYCCFYTCPVIESLLVGVGNSGSSDMTVEDCCGILDDVTFAASWSSGNVNVLSSAGVGSFSGVEVGSARMNASANLESQSASGPYCAAGCKKGPIGGGNNGQVAPVITSISPDAIWVGAALHVTINGRGFGTSPTVNLPSGFTLSGASYSDTSISGMLAISTSAGLGNSTITVTNQLPSNGYNFVADYPVDMIVLSDTTLNCMGCAITEQRNVEYQVKMFSGADGSYINLEENATTANWTCSVPATADTSACTDKDANADSNGIFTDGWSVNTDSANPSGCGWDMTADHWEWCTLDKAFGTLNGHIGQFTITIDGVTSTLQNKNGLTPGTVIKP
ncbi:MAG: IPT/TIG domain-containing protein, partial [Terriglobales bacterium]